MKCRSLSMNHRKSISWILRQLIIRLAILIRWSKKIIKRRLNKDLQSIGDTAIKTHSMPKHCRLSYVNEKLWYMYLKKWRQKPVTWTGWRSKYEKKQTLGSTTSEEKIKILALTTESWSIVKAASYFSVSEYLIRQARELKEKFMVYFVKTVVSLFLQAQQRKSSSSMRMTHTHVWCLVERTL